VNLGTGKLEILKVLLKCPLLENAGSLLPFSSVVVRGKTLQAGEGESDFLYPFPIESRQCVGSIGNGYCVFLCKKGPL
jgi:hypothetical protein